MKKKKTIEINVTARFEVTFVRKVTMEQFKELDSEEREVGDIVDESEAYAALASDGTCDMEWDYRVRPAPTKKPGKAKK